MERRPRYIFESEEKENSRTVLDECRHNGGEMHLRLRLTSTSVCSQLGSENCKEYVNATKLYLF